MKTGFLFGAPFFLFAALIALTRSFADDLVIPLSPPIRSLAVQANGQVLVNHGSSLTRLDEDGSVDVTFARGGWPSVLAIENDGMVLAEVSFNRYNRFSAAGAQELAFSGSFDFFLLQPDGKLVIFERGVLSRLNPNGTTDAAFISTPVRPGQISVQLALQEDGKILLGRSRDASILRFHPDGSPDTAFDPQELRLPWINTLLIQPDGKILVGGPFELARLNPDGTLDTAFSPAPEGETTIYSSALQANGKIIISGRFNFLSGQPVTNLARLNRDGSLDTSFPIVSFDNTAIAHFPLALQEDGAVWAGFSSNVVRIANPDPATQSFIQEGSTLTWLRGGSSPEVFHTRFQSSLDGIVWTDLGSGQRITGGWRLEGAVIPEGARLRVRGYVTGSSYYLDFVPGAPAILTQPWDRTNNVNTVSVIRVSAKGLEPLNFQWFKDGETLAGAHSSALVLSNITAADSGGYSVIVSNAEGSSTSRVAQLTVVDPVILEQPASVWLNAGSPLTLSISAAGTGLTYQWRRDGQQIPGATSSTLVFTNATTAETGDYQVFLTGTYGTLQSDVATVHVNAALPESWNPPFEATSQWAPIQTAVAHNNELFVGGLFRTLAAPTRRHLVKFRSDGTVDPFFAPEPDGGEAGGVVILYLAPNEQLIVGGHFLTIAGQSQPHLARLHLDGSFDELFRPGIAGLTEGSYAQVSGVEVQPDGRILIAGQFSTVNGQPRPGVARLFPDGQLDDSFNPAESSLPPAASGLVLQPDGKIVVSGWEVRRLNADGTPDPTFTAPTPGSLQSVQADGKTVIRKLVEIGPSKYQYVLLRMNPDGTEDSSFSPVFDNYASVKGIRGDGSFLLTGGFTTIAGQPLPKLALLKNTEPASQFLSFDGTNAIWLRSGTSPEVARTIFEFSSDGTTWTNLGAGVRIEDGWQLAGLELNSRGALRARGFSRGSIYETAIDLPVGLKLGAPNYHPESDQIVLTASGAAGTVMLLQTSTDLKQWTTLQTNFLGTHSLQLSLTNLSASRAFYRLRRTTN